LDTKDNPISLNPIYFLFSVPLWQIISVTMDTRRQNKIAQLLKEEFSSILMNEGKNFIGSTFVTLTNVKVTSDIGLARFYISVYATADKESIIKKLNTHKFELRKVLGNKMRNDLRKIPDIEFFLDETLDYVDKINDLFKDLDIKEETAD
jgi:ribosome-binding factor A